jgi:hypothetical protein
MSKVTGTRDGVWGPNRTAAGLYGMVVNPEKGLGSSPRRTARTSSCTTPRVDGDGYRSLEGHQRLEFDVNQDPKGRRPPAFASSDPDGSGNPSHAAQ